MTSCAHCANADHAPAGCANRNIPMINRTCTCPCDRADFIAAPYWSTRPTMRPVPASS